MRAETPPRARSPRSSAGMTLVSLTTSASPGRRSSGRSRTLTVRERRAGPDDEQPRRVARARRPERDPVLGQIEIEKVDVHEIFGRGRRRTA